MALPFSHDHPVRSAPVIFILIIITVVIITPCHVIFFLWQSGRRAGIRQRMPSSVCPPHPAIRGWSRLGSLIAPTAATHETNYTGKSGNPQSRRRESIWKRHIVLRFHFLSNAAKLSEFLQLVGKINNALCITVFFLPPSLYLERVLFYMVCEC